MPIVSLIFFALFALIALANAMLFFRNRQQHRVSLIVLVGLILFAVSMISWGKNAPIYLWLAVLLDMGTLTLVEALLKKSTK